MSEIEKLMQNVGILPRRKCEFYEDCPLGFAHSCDDCDIEFRESNSSYPPFTPEKQLWLIKWLSDIDEHIGIHYDRYKGLFEMQTGSGGLCVCNDFEDALASRVNMIWQDLSEKQKQQVKEILE